MAIDRICIFQGEEYYIVGDAVVEKPISNEESLYIVVVAINKIETSKPQGIQRATWLPLDSIKAKLSVADFTQSEWFQGVNNGER